MALRRDMLEVIAQGGWLMPGTDPMDGIADPAKGCAEGDPEYTDVYCEVYKLSRFTARATNLDLEVVPRRFRLHGEASKKLSSGCGVVTSGHASPCNGSFRPLPAPGRDRAPRCCVKWRRFSRYAQLGSWRGRGYQTRGLPASRHSERHICHFSVRPRSRLAGFLPMRYYVA